MPLSDMSCRKAHSKEKDYKLTDGEGLYLLVRTNGSRLWRMNYRYGGKHKTLAFGAYPTVGLLDARQKRLDAKRLLAAGVDPAPAPTNPSAGGTTFEIAAAHWLETNSNKWQWDFKLRIEKRLKDDVYPSIGTKALDDISTQDVLDIIRKLERRKVFETARRVRQNIDAIFKLANLEGRAKSNPAANVGLAMAPRPKVKRHHSLKATMLPRFFRDLAAYDGEPVTRLAIEFIIRTFVRTDELRGATWAEIEGNTWRIPPERMKMKREHLVPLTPQSLAVLTELRAFGGDLIVPGANGQRISENTMLFALYRMGYKGQATIHGFRTTASTVLNESGLFDKDWIEMQLAHNEEDEVRAAYNSAEYLIHRRKMMQWWSDYIDQQKNTVVSDLDDIFK